MQNEDSSCCLNDIITDKLLSFKIFTCTKIEDKDKVYVENKKQTQTKKGKSNKNIQKGNIHVITSGAQKLYGDNKQ